MRFLLILGIVLLLIWQWRHWRSVRKQNPPQNPKPGAPVDMLPCAHCGTHVPTADAVAGQRGRYCSTEHRDRAEP